MPLGNQVALSVAMLAAYFLGLLEALDRLPYGQTLELGAIGLGVAVLIGLAASPRGRAHRAERLLVSLLRGGLSGGVFIFVFDGMRLLLKLGDISGAVASWLGAGILALLLARLTPARTARPSASGRARRATPCLEPTTGQEPPARYARTDTLATPGATSVDGSE